MHLFRKTPPGGKVSDVFSFSGQASDASNPAPPRVNRSVSAMQYVEKERSDVGCLLRRSGSRICLANFVNQSGLRKLAANQSQVEGN